MCKISNILDMRGAKKKFEEECEPTIADDAEIEFHYSEPDEDEVDLFCYEELMDSEEEFL